MSIKHVLLTARRSVGRPKTKHEVGTKYRFSKNADSMSRVKHKSYKVGTKISFKGSNKIK